MDGHAGFRTAARTRAVRDRATYVGRTALYCLTLFLSGSVVSLCFVTLLVFAPLEPWPWFDQAMRTCLGATLIFGAALLFVLFVLQRFLVPARGCQVRSTAKARVHIGLTAYNDEACIAQAVSDFRRGANDIVGARHKIVVVENNSSDETLLRAQAAGADAVVTERVPGYGACCMRALAEASHGLKDDDIVVLAEGDQTFSGGDLAKFMAFLENADLVLGTRATQELRDTNTQMDWLINPANQIVAKLIQTRFWGTRLTDVGCTYRAMWVGSYRTFRDRLDVQGNHFSAHMMIEALKADLRVIEIPIVFRKRGGLSKGVGNDKVKAAVVAVSMLGRLFRA